MQKLIKYLYTIQWIRFGFIPLLLLLLWIALTLFNVVIIDTSFSILSYSHDTSNFTHLTHNKLLAGESESGEFRAVENNLGIVSIKFQTFIRPPYVDEDVIEFRLKEKGAKNWYYQNTYRDGLIYDIPLFPFGFPKIANSQGKIYQFEITSFRGNLDNSVAVSDKWQILFSKYQVSKNVLVHDKKEMGKFLAKKFINAFFTTDVLFSSFIYMLPFLFYLLWLSPIGNKYMHPWSIKIKHILFPVKVAKYLSPYYLILIMVIVILLDIFIIQLHNDIVYLVITVLWVLTYKAYHISSKTTFLFVIVLLLLPPIFLSFRDQPTAEKAAIWAYMLLVSGIIQAILELKESQLSKSSARGKM